MGQYLIVTNAFGDYRRGDQISDPAEVAEIRESHNAANVVAVPKPDDVTPAPAASAASAPAA